MDVGGTELHWDITKYSPIALPSGYSMVAAELDYGDPFPDTVTAETKSAKSASGSTIHEKPEKSGMAGSTFLRQNAAAVDKTMNVLLSHAGQDPVAFTMKKYKTGKPYGRIGGRQVGVSISHCRSLLLCSLHINGETGVDVEPCERTLHPRLRHRICHPDEINDLPEELCGIRLWTVKEAVLKYQGTGLRMAMNRIKLDMMNEHLFRAELESGIINVASFTFRNHWIAAAFRNK